MCGITLWKWFCRILLCIYCFLKYSTPTRIRITCDVNILNILGLGHYSWFPHEVSSQNEQGNRHLGLEAWNIWVSLYNSGSAAWLVYSCGVLWMVAWHQYLIERRMTGQSVKRTNYACQPLESNETKYYHTPLSATAWFPTGSTHIYWRYFIHFKVLAVRVWFKTMLIIIAIDLCNFTIETSPFG